MGRINWVRVLWGGFLAGLVINAGEMIAAVALREQYAAAMEALGKPLGTPSASALVLSLLITFGIGVFAVWLYAAIRPRYGPGPKTAIVVGLATLLIQGSATLRYCLAGLIPARLLAITAAIALAEFVLGSLLGAWAYRER